VPCRRAPGGARLPYRGDRGRTSLETQRPRNDVVGDLTTVYVESAGQADISLESCLPAEVGQGTDIRQCSVGQRKRRGTAPGMLATQ
jgi:hypothetical protein